MTQDQLDLREPLVPHLQCLDLQDLLVLQETQGQLVQQVRLVLQVQLVQQVT